ncbi:hypothetical protein QBC37DRAFT_387785 [Rhypophila decipiens]|uniref:Uncharacterized protein n=1 Tax=Rhypophila decipiens TaxID=261697 RepID=A0AAN6YBM2_9PEZI|nr:hypothetical protein QBC37DRAFT_387785 [Rhypophila decipiens]
MAEPKRPADVPMPSSTIPVELNDDLRVTVATLTEEPVLVEWTQNWGSKKSDTYYAVTFSNATKNNDPGRLFIASKYMDAFKAASKVIDDGNVYSFKVDDKFRYGQDAAGKNRFLVLHDPSNKIFQHRFASNKKIQYATKAGDIVTGAANRGKEEVKLVTGLIASKFGDELRKF